MGWLSGWSKRKKITITGGASGAQTDFQLKLYATYRPPMQGDWDDVRFTQADGTTLIDAWLEYDTGDEAWIWVEFPTTPANTVTQDYYMYYGNAGAASDWDGVATFIQFDDFEGASIDAVWTKTGTPTTSTDYAFQGSKSAKLDSDAIKRTLVHSDNIRIKYWLYQPSNAGVYIGLHGYNNYALYSHIGTPGAGDISYHDGSWHDTGVNAITGAWKPIEFNNFVWGSPTQDIYYNDVRIANDVGQRSSSIYNDFVVLNGTGYIDCFLVAKYAANPPTYAFGSEECVPAGILRNPSMSGGMV